jgi:hypothetical protein
MLRILRCFPYVNLINLSMSFYKPSEKLLLRTPTLNMSNNNVMAACAPAAGKKLSMAMMNFMSSMLTYLLEVLGGLSEFEIIKLLGQLQEQAPGPVKGAADPAVSAPDFSQTPLTIPDSAASAVSGGVKRVLGA